MHAVLLGTGALVLVFGVTVCTTFSGLVAEDAPGVPEAGVDAGGDTLDAAEAGLEASHDAATATAYMSMEEAAKACSMIFSCPNLANSVVWSFSVPVDDLNYSLCLHWLGGPISKGRVGLGLQSEALRCIAEASTCKEAASCLWIELMSPGDPRCADAGDGGEECADDGGTVLRCQYNYALNCKSAYYSPGSKCLEGPNEWKGCGLEQNCSAVTSCVGPVLTYCAVDTLKYGINCSYGGYSCGFEAESGMPCVPEDGFIQCKIPGASRCANDMVWVCDGLYESAFDCASMGLVCTAVQGAPRCAPPGASCTPTDQNQNVCRGTSIDVCVGGIPKTFDCESVGLTCIPGAQGKSAHCGT